MRRARELLDVLYQLNLWRGDGELHRRIIEGLNHLAVMSGLGSPPLAALVAAKLWEMCWHYVGPEEVPMRKQGLASVLGCVDALDALADFNFAFGRGRKAAKTIAEQGENFFQIGLWYSKRRIVNAVMTMYEKAVRSCYGQAGKLEFPSGRKILWRSLRRLQRLLVAQRPAWRYQRRRINELLGD